MKRSAPAWLPVRLVAGILLVVPFVVPICVFGVSDSGEIVELIGSIGDELGVDGWLVQCGLWLIYAFILLLPLLGMYVVVMAVVDLICWLRSGSRVNRRSAAQYMMV